MGSVRIAEGKRVPEAIRVAATQYGRRFRVSVDGNSVDITEKSLKYLAILALARLAPGDGWIEKKELDTGDYHSRYIHRLCGEIGGDYRLWEVRRDGMCRLIVPREGVLVNVENLRKVGDASIDRFLDGLKVKV